MSEPTNIETMLPLFDDDDGSDDYDYDDAVGLCETHPAMVARAAIRVAADALRNA